MGVINQLDSEIYNRISAGEVVERPFSVVKEIVENAIDAGATRVNIEIIDGGRESIRVSDNGIGLAREDLRIAFLPHATSKIKSLNDLDKIATLGFRGEALASIASVAIVEMQSKQSDAKCGYFIKLDGGIIKDEKPINMADGTIIEVTDLFYNTPARAKFLKKAKSEEHDISKLVIDMILANPHVAIAYSVDGKVMFNSTGRGLEDAVYSVYSKEITNNLLTVKFNNDGYRIYGYISTPKYTKPTRAYQTTVINGRIINNSTVSTAVTQAYGDSLMRRNFPIFIIDIVMPFDSLDVNVTPNKTDVRFVDARNVFSKVYRAVKETLDRERNIFTINTTSLKETPVINDTLSDNSLNNKNIQSSNFDNIVNNNTIVHDALTNTEAICTLISSDVKPALSDSDDIVNPKVYQNDSLLKNYDDTLLLNVVCNNNDNERCCVDKKNNNELIGDIQDQIASLSAQNTTKENYFIDNNNISDSGIDGVNIRIEQTQMENTGGVLKDIKIIGQIFKTYLLVSDENYAYIIDQHAAHERMIYDKLVDEIDNNYIASQMLLIPQIIELNPIDAEFVSEIIDDLQSIGLEIEEFGNSSFKITAVPSVFGGLNFNNYIDEILKSKRSLQQIKVKNIMRDKLAITACKAAIKAGDELSQCEIEALIAMIKDDTPLQCPHGRPAIIRIERKDIDKIFKRIL